MFKYLKKNRWIRRGSGTMIYGVMVSLTTTWLLLLIIQNFIVYEKHIDTQNAIDALADGVAINTVVNMGEYEDAMEFMPELIKTIGQETNVRLFDAELDKEIFKKDTAAVEAKSINSDLFGEDFAVKKTASTKFYRYGMATDYISMAIALANDPLANYSMSDRYYIYNDTGTHNMDCSSFVFYALFCSGHLPGMNPRSPFNTSSMGSVLSNYGFTRVGASWEVSLRPGDILIRYDNGATGADDHTEIYIGNGMNAAAVKIKPNTGEWATVYRYIGY